MMYHEVMLYTMEPYDEERPDEIIEFNKQEHEKFEYDNFLMRDSEIYDGLTLFDKMVSAFFHTHALWVWNEEERHPDHDVALIVSDEQLASVFDESVELIRETLLKLIQRQIIGVVLLPDGRYAYHCSI